MRSLVIAQKLADRFELPLLERARMFALLSIMQSEAAERGGR